MVVDWLSRCMRVMLTREDQEVNQDRDGMIILNMYTCMDFKELFHLLYILAP